MVSNDSDFSFSLLSPSSMDTTVFQKELDRRHAEVGVAGGGVSVAVTRFPPEQKRPIGPRVVIGVRDGVLRLFDSCGTLSFTGSNPAFISYTIRDKFSRLAKHRT